MRGQYAQVIDVAPTVLEALGLEPPLPDRRRGVI
jgi:arylsulfatase A-like enzyme